MKGRELEEVAVVVGNYPAADDSDVQKTLQKLKYTTPNCLDVKEGKATNQSLAGWRRMQKRVQALSAATRRSWARWGTPWSPPIRCCPKTILAANRSTPWKSR